MTRRAPSAMTSLIVLAPASAMNVRPVAVVKLGDQYAIWIGVREVIREQIDSVAGPLVHLIADVADARRLSRRSVEAEQVPELGGIRGASRGGEHTVVRLAHDHADLTTAAALALIVGLVAVAPFRAVPTQRADAFRPENIGRCRRVFRGIQRLERCRPTGVGRATRVLRDPPGLRQTERAIAGVARFRDVQVSLTIKRHAAWSVQIRNVGGDRRAGSGSSCAWRRAGGHHCPHFPEPSDLRPTRGILC